MATKDKEQKDQRESKKGKGGGDKKGEERKKAMSSCLKGENPGASDKQKAQQQKMKDCNMKAEGKKGDERKAFMSGCLKG